MSYIYFSKDGTQHKSDLYEKVTDRVFKDYPNAEPDPAVNIPAGNDHTRFRQGSRLVAVIWSESLVKGV